MNIIDLRVYADDSVKIVYCRDNKVMFLKNEEESDGFKRVLYLYDARQKKIDKINKDEIPSCEGRNYSYIYNQNVLITNVFEEKNEYDALSIYKINTETGDTEKVCSIKLRKMEDVSLKFINQRYCIIHKSEYGIDDKHFDVDKDIEGEYEHAYLYDMDKNEYSEIKDRRIALSRNDDMFAFKSRGKEFFFFGEHYVEDYEQEEMFKNKYKQSQYKRNSHRESVNVIDMQEFIESVDSDNIPFNQIHKTEINGVTRFFSEDSENIYFRVKDFKGEVETIYALNKDTLKTISDKMIGEMDMGYSKDSTMWYDGLKMKIYNISIKDKKVNVKEIYNNSLNIQYDMMKGDFSGIIDKRYLITVNYVDNVDETTFFTEVTDMETEESEKYEATCEIYNSSLILI